MGVAFEPVVQNIASHEIPRQFAREGPQTAGVAALFTLDEGLERTINWYRQFEESTA